GDLGGGSLELTDVRGGRAGTGITLPIGGLALLDLSGNSPRKAQRLVRDALETAAQLGALRGRTFYAVGGTWRALARLHMAERGYPLRVMHGYRLPPEDGIDFLRMVERTDAAVLKEIDAVSEARRPLLAYGAIVLEEIIRLGRPRDIAISALGVREGLLFERLDDAQRAQDPLLSAAAEFNILRSRSPAHNVELIAWTDRFVASARLDETAEERRLRHAACLLADIGWRAHPDYRGDQSVNLISNANFIGIDHPGRAFLALAILHRHEGLSGDKAAGSLVRLAGPRLAERARLLGGALRVAYPVSVAMAGILPRAPLVARGPELTLSLPEDLAELAGERLVGRMRQLAKITGLEPRILIG
ncbi:MAG TPA: exopolyphosphatase, partial [Salinarimonas sp.]|nr:exopolyphosphatase [Salinarimonas sp.]